MRKSILAVLCALSVSFCAFSAEAEFGDNTIAIVQVSSIDAVFDGLQAYAGSAVKGSPMEMQVAMMGQMKPMFSIQMLSLPPQMVDMKKPVFIMLNDNGEAIGPKYKMEPVFFIPGDFKKNIAAAGSVGTKITDEKDGIYKVVGQARYTLKVIDDKYFAVTANGKSAKAILDAVKLPTFTPIKNGKIDINVNIKKVKALVAAGKVAIENDASIDQKDTPVDEKFLALEGMKILDSITNQFASLNMIIDIDGNNLSFVYEGQAAAESAYSKIIAEASGLKCDPVLANTIGKNPAIISTSVTGKVAIETIIKLMNDKTAIVEKELVKLDAPEVKKMLKLFKDILKVEYKPATVSNVGTIYIDNDKVMINGGYSSKNAGSLLNFMEPACAFYNEVIGVSNKYAKPGQPKTTLVFTKNVGKVEGVDYSVYKTEFSGMEDNVGLKAMMSSIAELSTVYYAAKGDKLYGHNDNLAELGKMLKNSDKPATAEQLAIFKEQKAGQYIVSKIYLNNALKMYALMIKGLVEMPEMKAQKEQLLVIADMIKKAPNSKSAITVLGTASKDGKDVMSFVIPSAAIAETIKAAMPIMGEVQKMQMQAAQKSQKAPAVQTK